MSDTFEILLLEDDEAHAYVARHLLERHSAPGSTYRVTHVDRMALAEAALADSVFDLILADLSVPDCRGVETIERLRHASEGTPVVVLSALSDETVALEALRLGAQDYVIKEELSRAVLLRAVRYAIERRRSREDAEVRGLLEATLDSLSAQVAVLDRGGRILAANGAWRSFAAAAGVPGADGGVGLEYTEVGAALMGAESAARAGVGIAEVLGGAAPDFYAEYECASNGCWLSVRVNASRGAGVAAVVAHEDITSRRQAEEALRRSRDLHLALFDHFPTLIWRTDAEGRYDYFNRTLTEFTGRTVAEELATAMGEGIHPDDREHRARVFRAAMEARSSFEVEFRARHHSGEYRHIHETGRPFAGLDGEFLGYVGACVDLSRTRQLEEQLRQAQKMEAVGRLAGGVAHDFNNILTAIRGNAELILLDLPPGSAVREDVEEIRHGAERAATLTAQLLAFGRRQRLSPRELDLNTLVRDMEKMLRRVVDENIALITDLDPALDSALADPGQVEQVVMNLVLNAWDALPEGGRITISTRPCAGDGEVEIAVADNGRGIADEIREHIFEPFFTTKAQGEGSGLGLATVHGIVQQSGGSVSVESRPGQGAVFRVRLPRGPAPAAEPAPGGMAQGSGTVLVVEDEEMVRTLLRKTLGKCGYRVLEAAGGAEALAIAAAYPDAIDLLLSDLVMPGMSGRELHARILPLRPDIRALFVSGYSADAVADPGPASRFLAKPFTPSDLVRRVREALAG